MGETAKKKLTKGIVEVSQEGVTNNLKRFIKKIPANSKSSVKTTELVDGYTVFEATSPGRVPESKAVYKKWVNSEGETVKMLKTTFDPEGKVIHIKPK